MGLETRCTVRHGRKKTEAKVLLESTEVIVRGELALAIPFRDVTAVRAEDGWLEIAWSRGTTAFELGSAAEKWAKKITSPKGLIDKLGVKADQRVSVTGIDDAVFLGELAARTQNASRGRIARGSAIVFLGVRTVKDLSRLETAVRAIERDGAIWVVWPKGRPEIKEDHVRAAGRTHGLVDVKVASFSEMLSALKLVIPVARR